MTYVQVITKCPGCGGENKLLLSHVSPHEKVSCSRCGLGLGVVGELVAATAHAQKRPVAG